MYHLQIMLSVNANARALKLKRTAQTVISDITRRSEARKGESRFVDGKLYEPQMELAPND